MSQQELTSYRLSSLQEPSEEMLHAIMEQVAERARQSTAKFQVELHRRFELIAHRASSDATRECLNEFDIPLAAPSVRATIKK